MDHQNLVKRGHVWYVTREIPPSLRQHFGGKKRFVRTLATRDLATARKLRRAVLDEWDRELDAARQGQRTPVGLLGEARWYGQELEKARKAAWEAGYLGRPDEPSRLDAVELMLSEQVDRIVTDHGEQAASLFHAVATGKGTVLSDKVEPWLAEGKVREKTRGERRAAVRELLAWAGGEIVLEQFTKRTAGEFVEKRLKPSGRQPATINKALSSYSSLWKWLRKRGHVEVNPWEGQSLATNGRGEGDEEKERPFTDDEVVRLFGANPDGTLRDLMAVAALSGMRLEEIAQLRVEHAQGGLFRITKGKSAAARRVVPIHSELAAIITRRMEGKKHADWLFHELSESGPDGQRSWAVSKRFGRFREAAGVDAVVEGHRRSKVNFHSFRRWFVTKAQRAGVEPSLISAVVGHQPVGMTLGVYSGGPSDDQRRTCVEAVRLPEKAAAALAGASERPARVPVRRRPVRTA